MRKIYSVFICCFFSCLLSTVSTFSQPVSFYLDSAAICFFTNDALYFEVTQELIKSDYSGNILWSKHIDLIEPFIPLSFSENAIYGYNYDSVIYKLDTAGNIIWKRKFMSLVYPFPGAIQYTSNLTPSDDRLYVSIVEWDQSYFSSYFAQLVFDTSGSVIHAWSATNNLSPVRDGTSHGVPSIQGNGAWLAGIYSSGITSVARARRVDSTGQVSLTDSIIVSGNAEGVTINNFILMPDSNYLLVANKGMVNGLESIDLIKFNDNGHILWKKTFGSLYYNSGLTLCEAISVTIDSTGNIYFYGKMMDSQASTYQRPIIVKINNNGNILWIKSWTSSLISSTQISMTKLYYHNGSIYTFCNVAGHPGIMSFDTSFNNLCFSPDTIISFGITNWAGGAVSPIPYLPITYSNSNQLFNSPALLVNQVASEFCSSLSVNQIEQGDDIEIFPIPLQGNKFNLRYSSDENSSVTVYTLTGNVVKELKLIKDRAVHEVDLPGISAGIYFVNITSKKKVLIRKLIVE